VGLLATVCLLVGGVALLGLYRLHMPAAAPAPDIQIANTPPQIERGERLAYLCVNCHASSGDLPLDGAAENISSELGVLYPPNLTPGGPLHAWTDGEIVRAIREGVHQNGRALLLMPSDQYHGMSDADVQALVAYLRTQPVVERTTPETRLNLLGAVVVGLGLFPVSVQPPITAPVAAPSAGPTLEHGAYLVELAGCRECHGDRLEGGTSQFVPNGPNLPVMVSQWSAEAFIQTMRTGVDPYGHAVDPALMPWQDYAAAFNNEELEAIYTYIHGLASVGEE
jgi:mono/diheme cytochrome c family protein